jgi:hypothetical protein
VGGQKLAANSFKKKALLDAPSIIRDMVGPVYRWCQSSRFLYPSRRLDASGTSPVVQKGVKLLNKSYRIVSPERRQFPLNLASKLGLTRDLVDLFRCLLL